jgi:acyl-coenzyme A synthetase/AMP-(fatty) acid ligase
VLKLRGALGECAVITDDAPVPTAPSLARQATPGPATECALLYTSGTTGKPKGCVLSNDYFLRCGRWYTEIGGLCTLHPGEDRLITPLPMTHMNAMACSTLGMVLSGGCIIALDRFHPRSWWRTVRDSKATIMHSLGVMPTMLLGLDASPEEREHAVGFGFAPGTDPRYHAAFEERFGIPMIDAWAMTETGAAAVVIASEEPRLTGQSCFGRARPFMQYRIVDPSGADTPDDTPGELLVRATAPDPRAGFFTEYLGDLEATEAAWEGGWFHTGDVVRRDTDGNLFFVDRWKNVIRRSGENIAAAEVESVLRQHSLVGEVACAAVPDDLRGEEVLACIVPREPVGDIIHAAADVVAHTLRELAYFKAPGYVAFVDALPLTATNKVQRGELKAWARELPGTAACVDTRHLKRRQ